MLFDIRVGAASCADDALDNSQQRHHLAVALPVLLHEGAQGGEALRHIHRTDARATGVGNSYGRWMRTLPGVRRSGADHRCRIQPHHGAAGLLRYDVLARADA